MIACFIGDDTQKARMNAADAFAKAKEVSPLAPAFRFDGDAEDRGGLEEALGGGGLFGAPPIVLIDGFLEEGVEDGDRRLSGAIELAMQSGATLIVRESELSAGLTTEIKGHGGNITAYAVHGSAKAREHQPWGIADGFAERDKKKAWVEFQNAVRAGQSAEQIHGVLFWGAKMVAITMLSGSDDEAIAAGVSPKTIWKWKKAAKNFTKDEILDRLGELKDMPIRAHRGDSDLLEDVERLLLSLR
jgi:hypothetical protein